MSGGNTKKKRQARVFDLRLFPMDLGRAVSSPMLLFFRMKKIYLGDPQKWWDCRGGAVIAPNHTSFRDPFLLGCTFWMRRVFFLTGEIIMGGAVRDLLLRGMGCIKVRRGDAMDSAPIGKVLEVLKAGHCCAVFPQGQIERSGEIGAIKGGAVLIAAQAEVPVIPMYSRGREHWWQRRTVILGEPLYCHGTNGRSIPTRGEVDQLTEELRSRLERCKTLYDEIAAGGKER